MIKRYQLKEMAFSIFCKLIPMGNSADSSAKTPIPMIASNLRCLIVGILEVLQHRDRNDLAARKLR